MKTLSALTTICVGAMAGSKMPVYLYVDDWSTDGAGLSTEFVKMAKAGASHIIMAFHLAGNSGFPSELADTVAAWDAYPQASRQAALKEIHDNGAKLLISSGGESEGAYWLTVPGDQYGRDVCNKLKTLDVDGIDFDKEGFGWMNQTILDWTNQAVAACRSVWPEAIITAAPQAPHLSGAAPVSYADGLKSPNTAIDHYLIQYYNQWPAYDSYDQLFGTMDPNAPSIKQIMSEYPNAPKDTFVVGKPRIQGDGSSVVSLSSLKEWICRANKELGYTGGSMFWKHHVGGDLTDITMMAAPCDGTNPDTPTSPPATTAATTAPPAPTPAPVTTAQTTTTIDATTTKRHCRPRTTAAKGTTTVPTSPAGKAVEECAARIGAIAGFEDYDHVCKAACANYLPGGSRASVCSGTEAPQLVGCVMMDNTFCGPI